MRWRRISKAITKRRPPHRGVADFAIEGLNEAKVLKLCLDAGIIVKNVYNGLEMGLKSATPRHPNDVSISRCTSMLSSTTLISERCLKIA